MPPKYVPRPRGDSAVEETTRTRPSRPERREVSELLHSFIDMAGLADIDIADVVERDPRWRDELAGLGPPLTPFGDEHSLCIQNLDPVVGGVGDKDPALGVDRDVVRIAKHRR